jgi:hypothetical protein
MKSLIGKTKSILKTPPTVTPTPTLPSIDDNFIAYRELPFLKNN